MHQLPPKLASAFAAFCRDNDLDYERALAEAIADHVTSIRPHDLGDSLEDEIDDVIADAVTLFLDEHGGRRPTYRYIDLRSLSLGSAGGSVPHPEAGIRPPGLAGGVP